MLKSTFRYGFSRFAIFALSAMLASICWCFVSVDEVKNEADLKPLIIRAGDDEVARVWLWSDATNLHLHYHVIDPSPLQNAGTEWKTLFKTGDSVDLQLGLNADAEPKRTEPVVGDIRVLLTRTKDGPTAVLYRYRVEGAQTPERFWSPTGETTVDSIDKLVDAHIEVKEVEGEYDLRAAIPWKELAGKEYSAPEKLTLRGDVGVLLSDPNGQVTVERIYWSNKDTAVVADVPSEIRLHPDKWFELQVERCE
jgi:hypothetical protein